MKLLIGPAFLCTSLETWRCLAMFSHPSDEFSCEKISKPSTVGISCHDILPKLILILGGGFVAPVGSSTAGVNHLFFEEIAPKTTSFSQFHICSSAYDGGGMGRPMLGRQSRSHFFVVRFVRIFFCCLLRSFESVSVFPCFPKKVCSMPLLDYAGLVLFRFCL